MQKKSILKSIWLLFSILLLAIPVFIPSKDFDVIGVCLAIAIVLSYPLNMLFGWLFFMSGWFSASIGSLYLMLFVFTFTAYIQWFILIPRLTSFIRQKFFRKDLQISLNTKVVTVKTLSEPKAETVPNDWQKNWYDEQKRTPVERIFEKNED